MALPPTTAKEEQLPILIGVGAYDGAAVSAYVAKDSIPTGRL